MEEEGGFFLILPQADRASGAFLQAYEYVRWNNPGKPERWYRRKALRYLLTTASPPLTRQEEEAVRRASTRMLIITDEEELTRWRRLTARIRRSA